MGETYGPADAQRLLRQAGWVRHLAHRLVADAHAADDLAQEAFVAALEKPPRGAGNERTLRAWLARVLRTRAAQEKRSEANRRARESRVAAGPVAPDSSDPAVEMARPAHTVVAAVMALEEPDRSLILLRYVDGRDSSEIARRTGLSPAAVRKRLSRARQKLRAQLDAEHRGETEAWAVPLIHWLSEVGSPLSFPPPAPATSSGAVAISATTGGLLVGLKLEAWIVAALLIAAPLVWWARDSASAPSIDVASARKSREGPATAAAAGAPRRDESVDPGARSAVERDSRADQAPAPQAGIRLFGRISDPAGVGLPQALVASHRQAEVFETRSQADGTYELLLPWTPSEDRVSPHAPMVSTPVVSVVADAPEFHEAHGNTPLTELAPGCFEAELNLTLEPGFEWRGRVVDAAGDPVFGARVTLHPASGATVSNTITGFDGRYRLALPNDTPVHVTAARIEVGYVAQGPITPQSEADYEAQDLVLGTSEALEGIVIDRQGNPIRGVRVRAYPQDSELERVPTPRRSWENPPSPRGFAGFWRLGGWPWGSTTTDAAGRFSFRALRPGPYLLTTHDDDVQHGEFHTGDFAELVDQFYWIRVIVTDQDGLALPMVSVGLESDTSSTEAFNHSGTTEFEVDPGEYVLRCYVPGASFFTRRVVVDASRPRQVVPIRMDFSKPQGTLRLGVADEDSPVTRLEARLKPLMADGSLAPPVHFEYRREDGSLRASAHVELPGSPLRSALIPPGAYRLRVLARNCEPFERDVTLVAGEEPTIEGRLVQR